MSCTADKFIPGSSLGNTCIEESVAMIQNQHSNKRLGYICSLIFRGMIDIDIFE